MKTYINTSIISSICLIFILFSLQVNAGNYTWNGASSTAWGTSTNWTPNGVPSTNDTVTIVTGSNQVYLSANTSVKQFTISSGTVNLQSYTLSISSTGNFNSGTINNGVVNIYSTTANETFKGTQFGAKVFATGGSILLNGSVFNDSLFVVKKGTANDNGKGGNTFNKYVSITDSGTGYIVLSDANPDVFNDKLDVNRRGTGGIYVAHRGTGNQFNGDVTFNGGTIYSNFYGTATYSGNITLNGNVYFGYSGGSCSLSTGKAMSIGAAGISSGWLYFKNFVQQDSTSKISLTLTGSAVLYFESGSVFNDSVTASAPLLYMNGTRFNGVANLTNSGSSSVTSTGGCYFKKSAIVVNNCSSAITYSLSTVNVDTFATTAVIQNNMGTLALSKALFQGNVTLKNTNTSTASDRFFISSTGQTIFKGTVSIDNTTSGMCFGNSGGAITLESTASLSFVSGFTGYITLKGVTQQGVSGQSFVFPSSSAKLILGPNTTFNGPFTYYGHYINLNGATFNSTAEITRYGTSNDVCNGGNVFKGTTILRDSSGHTNGFYLANTSPDEYFGDVTFIQKGTGVNIYPAYGASSNFYKNIIVDGSSSISFGVNGGLVLAKGDSVQKILKYASYSPMFKKLKITKGNNYVQLGTTITVTDSLILGKGYFICDSTNLIIIPDNGKATGGSDSSFVQGPLKKIGDDAFVFPFGVHACLTPYHPLTISSPTSTSCSYTVRYFNTGSPKSQTLDSLRLSYTDYWSITNNSTSSALTINLGFSANSCFTNDSSLITTAKCVGTTWTDIGKSTFTTNQYSGSITAQQGISIPMNDTWDLTIAQHRLSNSTAGVADPDPYRGLYMRHTAPKTSVPNYVYFLGDMNMENEFLNYARDNNFQRLDIFDLYRIMPIIHDVNTRTGNEWGVDLCAFMNRAKTTYCIKEIAAVGGGTGEFTDINDFDEGTLTPPYLLSSSTIPDLESKMPYLKFIEQTYGADQKELAVLSEYIKFFLRVNDYNSQASFNCRFNIFTTELEFWNHDPSGVYANWPLFTALMPWLRNLQATTTSPFRIHTYCEFNDQIIDPSSGALVPLTTQVDLVDHNSDKIYAVGYENDPNLILAIPTASWQLFNSISLLGSNSFPNTVISPLLSSDFNSSANQLGIGYWLNDPVYGNQLERHTIERCEKEFVFDKLFTTFPNIIGDNIITNGSVEWFSNLTQRFIFANYWDDPNQSAGCYYPSYCTNNVLFYVDGQPQFCDVNNLMHACVNTDIAFHCNSNYELGTLVEFDFGDGSSTGLISPVDPLTNAYVVTHNTYTCAGNYTVTCTVHFPAVSPATVGCSYSFSRDINIEGVNIEPLEQTICSGSSANLTACDNNMNYVYTWTPISGNGSTLIVSPTVTTNYYVSATGVSGGCNTTASAIVYVSGGLNVTTSITNTNCGQNNGQVELTVTGGQTPYTFTIGNTTNNNGIFSNLAAGSYQCTISDNGGCSTVTSFTINSSGGFTYNVYTTPVTCNGGNDGSAGVTAFSGGTSPFTYLWSNGSTSWNVAGLSANTYTVTVTDANGCSVTNTALINEPSAINLTLSTTAATCYNDNSGTASVSASGGTAPYYYSWVPGGLTTSSISSLSAGSYTVTVTDNNNCSSTSSGVVGQPAQIALNTTSTPTTCNQGNDGTASVSASNGNSPYTYLWSPSGATGSSVSNLTAGTYSVTATDQTGCTNSTTVVVTEPPPIQITTSSNSPTCFGGSDGSVSVNVLSAGSFTYLWAPGGSTSPTVSGIGAGTYTVTVTNNLGCTISSAVVLQPGPQFILNFSSVPISCNGANDGSVSVNVSPTNPSYTYSWSPFSSSTNSITNCSPGTYTVTVTDPNTGCVTTGNYSLTQPAVLSATGTCLNCSTATNGSINLGLSVSGGTAPYTYNWNNGMSTAQNPVGLSAGIYSVIVTDAHGCTTSTSVTALSLTGCTATVHIGVSQPASYIAAIIGGNSLSGTVAIHADWIVDQNFTFTNHADVKIDPGVKITIMPGCTLIVDEHSHLISCTGFWQGIVLYDPTSKIIVRVDSHIKDALIGIDASNGASILTYDDAYFENDQVGMLIHNYSTNSNHIDVSETNFIGNPASPTYKGIVLEDISDPMIIGRVSVNNNLFNYLANGIDLIDGDIKIINSKFMNVNCTGLCLNGSSSAIRANDSGNGITRLIVGGSQSEVCLFYRCFLGICALNNVELDIQYNQFDNSSYSSTQATAVVGWNSNYRHQEVSNNSFNYFNYGINFTNAKNEFIVINNNKFNDFQGLPNLQGNRAIYIGNTYKETGPSRTIENNLIRHYRRGVLIVNQAKARISTNLIFLDDINPSYHYGIKVQNGNEKTHNQINSNYIYRSGTIYSALEAQLMGISVETGNGNLVSQNTIFGCGTGIRMFNNIGPNSILCNSIEQNYEGVTMESSNVGDQGSGSSASDNCWTRNGNSDALLYAKGGSAPSTWYVQALPSSCFYPNQSNDIIPSTFYSLLSATASTCAPTCTDPNCIQDQITRIVKEEGSYSNMTDEERYRAWKLAFEVLKNDSSLMHLNNSNDSILNAFYNAIENQNIDLLNQITKYLSTNDSAAAQAINSQINPTNNSEENEKLVNDVYLHTWGKNIQELDSSQTQTLSEIANQNPISGGQAVYSARVMLNLDLLDIYTEPASRMKDQIYPQATKLNIEKSSIKIIPNPTTGKFTLITNSESLKGSSLEICDLMSNLLYHEVLVSESNVANIDLAWLSNGMYICKLSTKDGYTSIARLIIEK